MIKNGIMIAGVRTGGWFADVCVCVREKLYSTVSALSVRPSEGVGIYICTNHPFFYDFETLA